MEKVRSFKWFMQELTSRRVKFSMLETILCSGDSTKSRYIMDQFGVIKQIQQDAVKLRYMLNSLLDMRSPILAEFNPSKLICILCRDKCITPLRAENMINLSENRILSMKIKSIHVIPFDSPEIHIYKLKVSGKPVSFRIQKTLSSSKQELPSDLVRSKAKEMYSYIHDFLLKASTQELQSIELYFLIDGEHNSYMLRVSRIKMLSHNDVDSKFFKRSPSMRFSIINNRGSSLEFIKILAKTIERERNSTSRNTCGKINAMNMEDLLIGMETSRPKNWAKDVIARKKSTHKSLRVFTTLIDKQKSYREISWANKFGNIKSQIAIFQKQAEDRKKQLSFREY